VPQVDLTITISVILGIGAVISPIFTAIINNRHQERMKRMEYEHQERMDALKHEREVYENYIRAAGACVNSRTRDTFEAFGAYSSLAMYSVPDDGIRSDMEELAREMWNDDVRRKQSFLVKIVRELHCFHHLR